MVVGCQIRAARALLDMSQDELAKAAGLTPQAIRKIESGDVQPREGTIADIVRALDERGAAFTDNFGVHLKPQGVEVLVGADGLRRFFEGVYDYVSKHGGLLQQMGVDEALFSKYMGAYEDVYNKKMTRLTSERTDIRFQAILREGDTNFACSAYADYRWLSSDFFEPVPFYIYGENLAIMSFQTVPSPTIVLHKIPAITHAYRKQFEAFWKMAKKPKED